MKYNLVYADFYTNYVALVKEAPIEKALSKNTEEFLDLLDDIPGSMINHAYGEGKWTVKEVLQHIIDAERVFSYRIIRIARLDGTPMASFDENKWMENANTAKRKWSDMVKEFKFLRKSNLLMIADFSKEQLNATGTASNQPVSTAALCYILAGHVKHHMNILKERYLKK
ncbi:DinB family protein [Flavihumibacter profundi]|jgi:hypothetical protein|uniref:DinB family protein n=1 Tax=Flavihumibacter profundi TaxID=2716883 RepID=UPI001CC4D35D|nr:DinB family protein [Flavihumibacter profundi]MBZ5855846.1 DinB family protein [Flavihumibacter profundi]